MNEVDFLKQLSRSPIDPPQVDVTARVFRTIRSGAANESESRTPWTLASASVLVALLCGIWAWQAVSDSRDSISALTVPFAVSFR